jgi:hypothetical protein
MLLICHEHYIRIRVISSVVQLQKQCSTDHDIAIGGVLTHSIETSFYLDWDKWDDKLAGYEITSDFFWISTKKKCTVKEGGQLSDSNGMICVPKHTIYWVEIEQVHADLAHKLKQVNGMNNNSDIPGKNICLK